MESSTLPLGILLLGVAAFAGFMAFRLRPWPVAPGTSTPVKPGAYAVQILQGKPPAASVQPDRQAEIGVIEGGLAVLLAVWATAKAAQVLNGGGGILGKLFGGGFGKIFSKLKGVLSNPEVDTVLGDAATAASEVP